MSSVCLGVSFLPCPELSEVGHVFVFFLSLQAGLHRSYTRSVVAGTHKDTIKGGLYDRGKVS